MGLTQRYSLGKVPARLCHQRRSPWL